MWVNLCMRPTTRTTRHRHPTQSGMTPTARSISVRFCARMIVHASRCPVFPVLLTTWHRSGGPSSRNVAVMYVEFQNFCLVVLPISLTQTLCPSCKRLSKFHLVDLWELDLAQSRVTNLEHLWDIFECRLCHGRQHRALVFVVFVFAVGYGICNRNFPSQTSDNHTRGRFRR